MTTRHRLADVRVDSVDQRQPLGRYLLLLFRAFEDELLATLARDGWDDITMGDLQVLHFVRPEGSTGADLARLAGVSKQAIARSVASLEARGYLRRRASGEDGREKAIAFSSTGVRLVEEAIAIIARIEVRYSRALGAGGLAELKRRLGALLDLHQEHAR